MKRLVSRRNAMIGAVASVAAPSIGRSVLAMDVVVHHVKMKRLNFDPKVVRVKVGDVIRWTNADVAPHTATAVEFGWDTQGIEKGESGDITVSADMELNYVCAYHPHMKGTIEIV